MRISLSIIVTLFCGGLCFSQTGSIQGKVTNARSGEVLPGAFVMIAGSSNVNYKVSTDPSGLYIFPKLPSGDYSLTVEFVGYASVTRKIRLKDKEMLKVNIGMEEKSQELESVSVFGKISQEEDQGARQKEKRANNLVNVISARAMERSPDINAANVLQRMSGLTIDRNGGGDEAYAIIRGLDPRYNNTLINGIKIASPDEKFRYVPLSIVPSDLLGSIEVHKSLLPEMEGDAIGGTVNMVMKDAPEKKIIRVLGSIGYNKIFFDRKFDHFSTADIRQKSLIESYGPAYTATPGDFSRSNLDFKPTTPIPNGIVGITLGQRFLNNKLGVMVAENFQNQYYGSNSVFNQAAPDIHKNQPGLSDYANRQFSTQQLNNGIVLHLDYNFNSRNKIVFTNVFLYSYLAQSRIIVDTAIIGGNGGRTVPGTGPVTTDYTSVTSHQYVQNAKLEGKHILSEHFLIDWTGVFSYAAKRTPDQADLALNKKIDTVHTTSDINGPYRFVTTPNYFDVIDRIWQHNEDRDYDGLANLTYKARFSRHAILEIKAGGLYRHKVRFNKQDTYNLLPSTSSSGIKQIFYNINSAQWTVYNSHGTYDYDKNNYRLFEDVTAEFGQIKISFPSLDIFGGVRQEHTSQGFTLNTFYPTGINGLTKDYSDLLPSAMIKYKLSDKTNLRASYFKSISRPNYYELVPAPIVSVSNATTTNGNPNLVHSVADNFDLRYEYFPREEEQLLAGVFYKSIQNPIEYAYISGTTYQPQNFGTATVYGLELAFTRYFGKIGVTGNYTYLNSSISSNKSYTDYSYNPPRPVPDTLQKRPMQGQTDHTLNVSLLYRDEKKAMYAQLAFQYIGRSLALVYPLYGYDYYQQPQSLLAFSAEKGLPNRHFTVFTKFNNLLNTASQNKINSLLVVSEITKFNFSVGIRYSN